MTVQTMRLFSIGVIALASAMAHAQNKLVTPAVEVILPPPPAAAPVVPARPVEMMPKPAKVTCHGDLITISADNSTLDSILAQVRGCTGAKIDVPEGASRVRSFEELGPGPVREVLDQLLSGTQYNYVIQSSDVNPAKVESVLLSMRISDGPGGAATSAAFSSEIAQTPARRAWKQMQRSGRPDQAGDEENTAAVTEAATAPESVTASAAPVDPVDASANSAQASAPEAATAPESQPAPPANAAAPAVDAIAPTDAAKAVQDRINSMQQMFDQRRQMIQKQNAAGSQGTGPSSN
jgi:hypothetical protein